MAESSAKSVDDTATFSRRCYGAQVVLLDAQFNAADPSQVFDQGEWKHSEPVSTGRRSNWFVDMGEDAFVLRHFKRGGAVARILGNKYWFRSEEATRSFAEFNLLLELRRQKLPVPEPVAAGYCKQGLWYTAQLLTRRIPDAQSWSTNLSVLAQSQALWSRIGETIAKLHVACVDHVDLNAHNILVDGAGSVFVIDFDKSFIRPTVDGQWRESNLARLKRSLHKILPSETQTIDSGWQHLLKAYGTRFNQSIR